MLQHHVLTNITVCTYLTSARMLVQPLNVEANAGPTELWYRDASVRKGAIRAQRCAHLHNECPSERLPRATFAVSVHGEQTHLTVGCLGTSITTPSISRQATTRRRYVFWLELPRIASATDTGTHLGARRTKCTVGDSSWSRTALVRSDTSPRKEGRTARKCRAARQRLLRLGRHRRPVQREGTCPRPA